VNVTCKKTYKRYEGKTNGLLIAFIGYVNDLNQLQQFTVSVRLQCTIYGCINIVIYVFLLKESVYSYCCLCILIVVHVFLDAATLTEVFPCFFLGCKANARV
jgi:hypothetical protein